MSFTTNVKNEVSKLEVSKSEKISELSAIINTIGKVNQNMTISTENASIARRIFSLIKDVYGLNAKISVRSSSNLSKGYKYLIALNDKKMIEEFKNSSKEELPKEYLVADNELKKSYIRGIFLSTGSISDPKKSRYHLEFVVVEEKYAKFILELLNNFDLNSKMLKREKKYMVYVKEAEKISDFLKIIRASEALLYFEDIRIYRDHKNMTNRLNNCEQANVDKIIKTATEQIDDIKLIENKYGLDILSEKVKQACVYRKKYPDVSMLELSEIISIETNEEITKSGLYHRINKVKKMANKIRDKDIN